VPPNEKTVNTVPSSVQTGAAQTETRAARRFKEVKALQQKGLSERAIARQLRLNRRTVRRYAVHDNVPVRRLTPQSTSTVKPYMTYLRSRMAEGCDNYTTLHQEIAALGFEGSYASVRRALLPLLPLMQASQFSKSASVVPELNTTPLSSRQAAWLLVRQPEKLKPPEIPVLDALCKSSTAITTLFQLAQDFIRIVREHRATELDAWLTKAHTSGISEMRHFAEGLVRDYAAVKSALQLLWSNGQVEGSVNKLKLIKRQQYGRGKLDLLRLRLIYAP
jgi:transposase